jgi:hypothetical protein
MFSMADPLAGTLTDPYEVTVATPGAGFSTFSTLTTPMGSVGFCDGFALLDATRFATVRLAVAFIGTFFGAALATLRFAVFICAPFVCLDALPRLVAFPRRAAACFLRCAIYASCHRVFLKGRLRLSIGQPSHNARSGQRQDGFGHRRQRL